MRLGGSSDLEMIQKYIRIFDNNVYKLTEGDVEFHRKHMQNIFREYIRSDMTDDQKRQLTMISQNLASVYQLIDLRTQRIKAKAKEFLVARLLFTADACANNIRQNLPCDALWSEFVYTSRLMMWSFGPKPRKIRHAMHESMSDLVGEPEIDEGEE